jgi:hypothetical protein
MINNWPRGTKITQKSYGHIWNKNKFKEICGSTKQVIERKAGKKLQSVKDDWVLQ